MPSGVPIRHSPATRGYPSRVDLVRIIPLGGANEIGKNCTVIEQGNDMVVIDCGLAFPTEEMPGVDIVIPEFKYLIENKDKIRGIFITHAHEDHVGALPYLLNLINVPVYATEFTHVLIRQKLEEKMSIKKADLRVMNHGDIVPCGALSVEPIKVTHSIPESSSMAIRTTHGIVLMTSDFKFDFTPVDGKLTNINRFGELGKEGVLVLMSDSTNVERPGWGPSESVVSQGLRKVMMEAEGRVLLTTFASNVHRIQQFMQVAAECGRKVAVVGRRMEQNIDICTRMKYIKVPHNTLIKLDEIRSYAPSKVAVLTTGSQGEPMSALVQMSKDEYGRLRIEKGDTLIYSARPIPGNEAAIWRTINRLFRQGAKVVYETPTPIHVSGHAYQEELKMMINLTRPYYVAPVHGEARHLHLYLQIARDMGFPEHRTWLMEDGVPLCLDATKAYTDERVPCGRVLVDFSGTPGISDDVLRDRSNLAKDGVLSVAVAVDTELCEIVGIPMIQAKGFNGPDNVLEEATEALMDFLLSMDKEAIRDCDNLRHVVSDVVRKFVNRQTQLRPLVLPSIIEI